AALLPAGPPLIPLSPPSALTTRELFERLGDVPLWRVCFDPFPGTATEEDLLSLHKKTGRFYELVEGTLVEKPMGYPESILAGAVIFWLKAYLLNNRSGAVGAPDGLMRLAPDRARMPAASFV